MAKRKFANPFRPGAGHQPPFLAGRQSERVEFKRLLQQDVVLENLLLSGLRGVGKTVLLDSFRPLAIREGWLWAGTDLSESISLSEERLAIRIMSDLASATSHIEVGATERKQIGFASPTRQTQRLDFQLLTGIFNHTPGLISDKLKAVLQFAWSCIHQKRLRGIIFAYDEAQNMADHATTNEYPFSLLLDCFQSLQKTEVRFMLALAGLPTLLPKLVEARTFTERMFRVLFLDRLNPKDCREAIEKPIQDAQCKTTFSPEGIELIAKASGGYPYLIQFICREAYDSLLAQIELSAEQPNVFIDDIVTKLDSDFYAGRWARATDRQRELLFAAAQVEKDHDEFSLQDVAKASQEFLDHPFSASQINRMFVRLSEAGMIYKDRHGKYAFAVPLLGEFIRRQYKSP